MVRCIRSIKEEFLCFSLSLFLFPSSSSPSSSSSLHSSLSLSLSLIFSHSLFFSFPSSFLSNSSSTLMHFLSSSNLIKCLERYTLRLKYELCWRNQGLYFDTTRYAMTISILKALSCLDFFPFYFSLMRLMPGQRSIWGQLALDILGDFHLTLRCAEERTYWGIQSILLPFVATSNLKINKRNKREVPKMVSQLGDTLHTDKKLHHS